MAPGATLPVIERDLGPPNAAPDAKFSDLNMLVNPGGRERTLTEYERLFKQAGLHLAESTPAGAGLAIFAARPA